MTVQEQHLIIHPLVEQHLIINPQHLAHLVIAAWQQKFDKQIFAPKKGKGGGGHRVGQWILTSNCYQVNEIIDTAD